MSVGVEFTTILKSIFLGLPIPMCSPPLHIYLPTAYNQPPLHLNCGTCRQQMTSKFSRGELKRVVSYLCVCPHN